MVVSLLCALINALRRILYSFMIAGAQAALELHVSHKPLLISEKKGNKETRTCVHSNIHILLYCSKVSSIPVFLILVPEKLLIN